MKTFSRTLMTLACCGSFVSVAALGQTAQAPASPPPVNLQLSAPPNVLEPSADATTSLLLTQAAAPAQDVFTQASDVAWATTEGGRLTLDLLNGSARPRTLVVRSTETDPKTLSALEEDLNVMSRILSKATKEKGADDDTVTAMGMKLRTVTLAGNSPAQNLYLDGYGALFLMHARFPLLPPPEPAKEEPRKESTSSTWDDARRELYGPKEPAPGLRNFFTKESPRESYDADKVARLKESLLEALKNASNIRNLKPGEFITVVVIGADNSPRARAVFKRTDANADAKDFGYAVREETRGFGGVGGGFATTAARPGAATIIRSMTGAGGETVMTLRAKKSDVDAFAKGDLKLEDFQKKVSVVTY